MPNYTLGSVYHIAKADFLQRVRSYSFLITLGICVFMIYSFVPLLDAGYTIVSLGNYRGYYNAAWIGAMVANCSAFFALFGFYLTNNAVQRDVDTGVGQIIAATRVKNFQYLLGKYCSNLAVLLLIVAIIAVMTVLMFWWRSESGVFEWQKLLFPLCVFTIPSMIFLAGLALFFDAISWIGKGIMNILFIVIWMVMVASSEASPYWDAFSSYVIMKDIEVAIAAAHGDWNGLAGTGILVSDSLTELKVFVWEGMNWTEAIFQQRLFWVAMSLALLLLSLLVFRRFGARDGGSSKTRKGWWRKSAPKTDTKTEIAISKTTVPTQRFKDIALPAAQFNFWGLLQAERKLLLHGKGKWWRFFTLGLLVTCFFVPLDLGHRVFLPLLWFFQVLLLSDLGCRVFKRKVNHYLFAYPYPLKRQLPAPILAASLFLLLLASPILIKLLVAGNFYAIYAIIVAALFFPTLATSLGTLTQGSKVFEVIFTILVYCYFNQVPYTDFWAAKTDLAPAGFAHYVVLMTGLNLLAAVLIRRRQIEGT